MIMMLVRTLLWGAAMAAAAWAFVFLKDSSGGVSVELNGRAYGPFAPLEFVAVVVATALLIWLLVKGFGLLVATVRFLAGDETALSRFWNRARERRGFDALSTGLIALAEGDGRTAMTKARKAERLLARPGLTGLVIAQAAESAGDDATARRHYKALASEPQTAFVGTRGLLAGALAKGETDRALKLARHAFTLRPREPEVLNTLFGLQSGAADWAGARKTLSASVSARTLSKDVAARREAILMLAEARAAEDDEAGRDLVLRAQKKSPGLIPAAVDAAAILSKDGLARKARTALKDAWRNSPHPDIASAFAALAPDETAPARRKRFRDLLDIRPDHPETKLLAAELALADSDWTGARKALGDLIEGDSSARALAIMAAVEKGAGASEEEVRGWLAKAITAPRGPQWTCDACGSVEPEWSPTCSNCDAFDTLAWKDAPAAGGDALANAAMGSLVAGADGEASLVEAEAPETDAEAKPTEAANA